jgi:hypothetical protein
MTRQGSEPTGINLLLSESGGKRLELLRELLPKATTIGWLVNRACTSRHFADSGY